MNADPLAERADAEMLAALDLARMKKRAKAHHGRARETETGANGVEANIASSMLPWAAAGKTSLQESANCYLLLERF